MLATPPNAGGCAWPADAAAADASVRGRPENRATRRATPGARPCDPTHGWVGARGGDPARRVAACATRPGWRDTRAAPPAP
eukprot:208710-Pleurochrysis_carterae.AAC.2